MGEKEVGDWGISMIEDCVKNRKQKSRITDFLTVDKFLKIDFWLHLV